MATGKYFAATTRLVDELQANINIAAWMRDALQNEMNDQFGVDKATGAPPKVGIDHKLVKTWRDVVAALEALTAAKIKLDASAKKMAESMTAEEELAAVRAYLRSLEKTIAIDVLKEELSWAQNAR